MAAALGQTQKSQASSSPTATEAGTVTARAHPGGDTFPPPRNVGSIGAPMSFQMHTRVRGTCQLSSCKSLREHTHTGSSESGHPCFLRSLSEKCVYVVPTPTLTD